MYDDKVIVFYAISYDVQVKSTQARTKKAGHEGQPSGKKDEATAREMQGYKENHFEDSLRHPDAQNHELQVRATVDLNVRKILLFQLNSKMILSQTSLILVLVCSLY